MGKSDTPCGFGKFGVADSRLASVLSLLVCFCGFTQAQQYVSSVKHYGPEQGLSHREVNAIFQDRQGFMWFGTKFGLNRFDGHKFTAYTKERNGLDFDDIHAIAQDAEGNLWLSGINNQSKITLFNPLTGKATAFQTKYKKQLSSSAFTDLQGLQSSNNGTIFLTNYQPASLISYHPATGLRSVPLPQFKTLGIFRTTAHNTVWAIANDNLILELTTDGQILHQFSHGQQDKISWLYGQRNAGIDFFYSVNNSVNGSQRQFYSVDEFGKRRQWSSALLDAMTRYMGPVCFPIDRTGLLWDGISLRDSSNRTLLTIAGQTSGESIENRSFYRDRNGQFWLGTSFGIYQVKLNQNHFSRLIYQETNKGEQVAAIRGISVAGDQVYANLEKFGLYSVPHQGTVPKKIYTNGLFVYGLTQDNKGNLLSGMGNQIVRYNLASGTHSTTELPDNTFVWSLYPFGHGQWLAGTQQGLRLVAPDKEQTKIYTQYNQFTELAKAHVLHIGVDRQGSLWVCTNTGLYTLDSTKGVTARYWSGGKKEFFLPTDSYHHFYQDTQGIFWLATANAGLIRWDRRHNQYRQFRRSEGLSNDNIYAIYPDQQDHLWLSSDYGIMRFDPKRLTTRSYFVDDGISHNEFNRIAHHQDERGWIYFGGLNGITAFDPRAFQSEKLTAGLPLRVTSFRQYDDTERQIIDKTEEVITTHTIRIEPNDRSSVLEFAMLNYFNAEKDVYAYQFTGIDADWTYQAEPTLRLSNLPYGDHQLLIKAQAADGQWSVNTLAIDLVVVRPFYLRTWFLIVMVLLTGVGVWAWLRWRIWQHQAEQKRLETEVRRATARIEHDKETMAQDKEIIEQQAKTLQQLDEAKSRFFTNISHEFRTPLTVILGMSTELEGYQPEKNPQQVRHSADLIKRNGTNLLRLINQILDLSKLEAGQMRLQPIRADLVGFARYVGESFHSMAKVKNIQLHFLSEEDTCEADFDKDKLQDIIANLLSNALKFTPADGHIYCQVRVREGWHSLSAQGYFEELIPTQQQDSQWIQISVSDTGPGIDLAGLPKVFDRFYQADSQTGGTGIGLSLVRELVLLMNGGLAVRNRPGQARPRKAGQKNGVEFVVSLPLTRRAIQAQPELVPTLILVSPDRNELLESTLAAADNKPVLLLVEDNDDVAIYIQTCLQGDYQVVRAENGQAGIDLAIDRIPDLILSDVMMPVKDGFALCDELKNDERTSHIPIVLLTARAAVGDRLAGLRRGADAYLVKPFLRDELMVVLSNLIQTRRLLQLHYSQLALGSSPEGSVPTVAENSLEDEFLIRLRTVVEAQLDNTDLNIDMICQLMGTSRNPLHQKMTALTGMSMNRYLRALRLQNAKSLLLTPGATISEVAYAVGFEDPKYFSRVFADEFGVTPASFRASGKD